jgi:hypothetical protein
MNWITINFVNFYWLRTCLFTLRIKILNWKLFWLFSHEAWTCLLKIFPNSFNRFIWFFLDHMNYLALDMIIEITLGFFKPRFLDILFKSFILFKYWFGILFSNTFSWISFHKLNSFIFIKYLNIIRLYFCILLQWFEFKCSE